MIKIIYIEKILNLIFPPVCGFCNEINKNYLCENCKNKFEKLKESKIDDYTKENVHFNEHFYLYKYNGEIRNKILSYKFKEKSYLYKTFARMIVNNNKFKNHFINKYDCIISVPIHKKRMKTRGYNQSELIAKEISILTNKPYYKDILKKNKNIIAQSSLDKEDRIKNVKGAFLLENKEKIQGKRILLFDDIFTTGSTVNECSKILLENGVLCVGICTIAKD